MDELPRRQKMRCFPGLTLPYQNGPDTDEELMIYPRTVESRRVHLEQVANAIGMDSCSRGGGWEKQLSLSV